MTVFAEPGDGSDRPTIGSVTSAQLRELLVGSAEFALLDAREQGVYHRSHLFHAACVPLSQLELLLDDLVPRRSTPIIWCDADGATLNQGGLAARAASRATDLGWTNCSVLDGGVEGWAGSGGEIYSGVNVPSKAFGEFVEHTADTPRMEAAEVQALLASAEPGRDDVVVLDARPMDEFRRMSIPGGRDCPGAELVHRIKTLVPSVDTTVVVNCAGRTRSIIGAQSLINAGLENPVVALKDGTMGWELAGYELVRDLARDQEVDPPEPGPEAREWAEAAAAEVGRRYGVRRLSLDEVDRWRAETDRTTYLLDVRTKAEFEAGHLAGSRHAPGGQLVQATDEYVATQHARLVLLDDNLVRATMTASWLRQLGWSDAAVLDGGLPAVEAAGVGLVTGPRARQAIPPTDTIRVSELARRLAEDPDAVTVLDVGTSVKYRTRGHIAGAWWGVRSRLDQARAAIGPVATLVLTSTDGQLAKLAVAEAKAQWPEAEVLALAGGNKGWRHGGHDMEPGFDRATTAADDVWYKPYDHDDPTDVVHRHMQDYLTWEVGLVDQIERDDTVNFPTDFSAGR